MIDSDAFNQIVVKIGDFGTSFRSLKDKKNNQDLSEEASIIVDSTRIIELKEMFNTESFLSPEMRSYLENNITKE
jgi:hypothetical protein